MPNRTNIERIIVPTDARIREEIGERSADTLRSELVRKIFEAQKEAKNHEEYQKKVEGLLAPLMVCVTKLPSTLFDAYPYRSTTVAANGDLVRLPVHARKFGFVYIEGKLQEKYVDGLKDVLARAGISTHEPWVPANEPEEAKRPFLGEIAAYGISFEDGDIGQYNEFFLLIKLSSQTMPNPTAPHDVFVWHLAVDSARAAAWGSPWTYPKLTYPRGSIQLAFDPNAVVEAFSIEPRHVPRSEQSRINPYVDFPGIHFERPRTPPGPPTRWSHEELGGGFSFVNPASPSQPKGFLAPIENQGEFWIDYDVAQNVHVTNLHEDFELLAHVDWKYAFYGRNFQAVAFEGMPIQASLRPPPPQPVLRAMRALSYSP